MRRNAAVNAVASTVFGVLLIHANCPAMREWLWADVLGIPSLYGCADPAYVVIRVVASAGVVFAVSSMLEGVRAALVERPLLDRSLVLWEGSAMQAQARSALGALGRVGLRKGE